jgi:carbon-monoxide dehydrogenase large subunit
MRLTNRLIGQSIERLEDVRFLRGEGEYVGDLQPDGLLHAVLLRSSVAHGVIRGIDVSAASALPGVVAVLTAADIGVVPVIGIRQEPSPEMARYTQPVIAAERVRYVGEPVALVVAESIAIAEDALELIALDIEVLPVVAGWRVDAPLLFEPAGSNRVITLQALRGAADAVFETAPYTRRESFHIHRHSAIPMEPRGLLAEWRDGHLTLRGAAKTAFPNRRMLAEMLALPEAGITMIEHDVGGGFGVRGEFYPEDFLIPFAARRLGRPLRWLEDRREHMLATNHARDVDCTLEIACDRDGTILAMRGEAHCDTGAYIRTAGTTGARNTAQIMSGPYRIPHIRMAVSVHVTNKAPVGTYRGPGRYEADFCRERLFDIVAGELGLDRVTFRRINLVSSAEQPWALATVQPLNIATSTDSGDYGETLDRCLADFGWEARAAVSGTLIGGRYHGSAVGCYIEGGASGPREHARIELEADGRFGVHLGASAIGQGTETAFAQIAADALEVPMGAISQVHHGATTHLKQGFGSYSSRSIVMCGSAVLDAAAQLREQMRAAAAARLGCAAAEVRFADDRLAGPDGRFITFADLGQESLAADGMFASGTRTYSYGAHAAFVSVDPGTGEVRVLDYVAVEDVGRAINPMIVHGQTMGAVVQGLGGTLLEELVYDADAQLLAGSLADYLLPTASDFAAVRAAVLQNYPSPNNPLGAKGAGEGGIIPVAGVIANAVADALRDNAVQPNILPLSPSRIWSLLQPG